MLKIVKVGGTVIDDDRKLDTFLDSFASLEGPKILIHGGDKIAAAVLRRMGKVPIVIEGNRITDRETLDIIMMVYAGLINKTIVNNLINKNCNAVGITGAEGSMVISRKRSPIPLDFGYVGEPEKVETKLLEIFLSSGFIPVIAPLTMGTRGSLLSTNADALATAIATAMTDAGNETELINCYERAGVYENPEDESSLLPELDNKTFLKLNKDNVLTGNVESKIRNGLRAVAGGVARVIIRSATDPDLDGKGGTLITP